MTITRPTWHSPLIRTLLAGVLTLAPLGAACAWQQSGPPPVTRPAVVPGDPDNSFLMQKLTGPAADEGDQMPDRGSQLDAATLAAIRTWIANGAKR